MSCLPSTPLSKGAELFYEGKRWTGQRDAILPVTVFYSTLGETQTPKRVILLSLVTTTSVCFPSAPGAVKNA